MGNRLYMEPHWGVKYEMYIALVEIADPNRHVINPQFQIGDVKTRVSGGSAGVNIITLPMGVLNSTAALLTISANEMQGANVIVEMSDQAGIWADLMINVQPRSPRVIASGLATEGGTINTLVDALQTTPADTLEADAIRFLSTNETRLIEDHTGTGFLFTPPILNPPVAGDRYEIISQSQVDIGMVYADRAGKINANAIEWKGKPIVNELGLITDIVTNGPIRTNLLVADVNAVEWNNTSISDDLMIRTDLLSDDLPLDTTGGKLNTVIEAENAGGGAGSGPLIVRMLASAGDASLGSSVNGTTYLNTQSNDDAPWQTSPDGGGNLVQYLDFQIDKLIFVDYIAVAVTMRGRLPENSSGIVQVQLWDYVTSGGQWYPEAFGVFTPNSVTSVVQVVIPIDRREDFTDANGTMRLGFLGNGLNTNANRAFEVHFTFASYADANYEPITNESIAVAVDDRMSATHGFNNWEGSNKGETVIESYVTSALTVTLAADVGLPGLVIYTESSTGIISAAMIVSYVSGTRVATISKALDSSAADGDRIIVAYIDTNVVGWNGKPIESDLMVIEDILSDGNALNTTTGVLDTVATVSDGAKEAAATTNRDAIITQGDLSWLTADVSGLALDSTVSKELTAAKDTTVAKEVDLTLVKAKTDNLPIDPASITEVQKVTTDVTEFGDTPPWTSGSGVSVTSIAVQAPSTIERPEGVDVEVTIRAIATNAAGAPEDITTPIWEVDGFISGDRTIDWKAPATNPATGIYERVYLIRPTSIVEDVVFKFTGTFVDVTTRTGTNQTSIVDSIGAVTVGDITQTALAKWASVDTLETDAIIGSVADLSKGGGSGSVQVAGFDLSAMQQLVLDDTQQAVALVRSVADLSKGAGGGTTPSNVTPIDLRPVPESKTIIVITRSGVGNIGERTLVVSTTKPQLVAIDFRKLMPVNGRILDVLFEEISAPSGGSLIITDQGQDKAKAKVMLAPYPNGNYVLRCSVTYADGGGDTVATINIFATD